MMRKVFTSRASLRVLRGSRALSSSTRSRVKIIGSDEAYTQIATDCSIFRCERVSDGGCGIIEQCEVRGYRLSKLDVDELNDTASKAGVRVSVSTVLFSGADEELLRNNAKQLNDPPVRLRGHPEPRARGIGSSTPPLSPLMLHVNKNSNALKGWEFPGWGDHSSTVASDNELNEIQAHLSTDHTKLSEWLATAICGNDILSSCLYVSGLVASKAGKLAPVALAIVAGILYLYRFIYGEVLNAVPLNGGSYNVLLNTTSKRVAAMAASLAILSYIATGVVSGTSACNYLASHVPSLEIVPATIGLLFIFAILSLIGITEMLCVLSAVYVVKDDFQTLRANFDTDFPDINLAGDIMSGNFLTAIFFGTSTAMLGISGFETSSQFVEEQADGVFPKTLRVAGEKMQLIVALDAFIVLSGAVLTAYVGVVGLVRRLASDRVVPDFLLHVNKARGTNHFIIIGYFMVATSLVLILHGDTETLSGVYTYAFLGLMTLFGTGCMLLKFKRAEIPRTVIAPWWSCILGVSMVVTTFMGNLLGDPTILTYFSLYFIAVLSLVYIMFERTFLLRMCLYCMRQLCPSQRSNDEDETHSLRTGARGGQTIARFIREINEPAVFFFCKTPNLNIINKAILYVRTNEQTHTLFIVHCHPRDTAVPEGFKETVSMFDHVYLKIKLNFLSVEGPFGPAMVEWVSRKYSQPKNLMFIKQPNHNFAHTIASLGGVRVITG
ncbi:Amino acid/polyamine transporter I [Phytophthora cactorum]|nr:Amino acid/polyamine transporter I [Phytophthora cactorum]